MSIKVASHKDALREVIKLSVDGGDALLHPRWTTLVAGGVLITALDQKALIPLKAETIRGTMVTEDPRAKLLSLRWLLARFGYEDYSDKELRKVTQDKDEATIEFEEMEDKWGHVILAEVDESRG